MTLVWILLGVVVRGERVAGVAVSGIALSLAGAWLVRDHTLAKTKR